MPPHPAPQTRVPKAVAQMCLLIAVLTALSLAFLWLAQTLHLNVDAGIITPPLHRFGDLTIYQFKFRLFHTAGFYQNGYPFTYPAPVALAYEFLFHFFPAHPVPAFVTICVACFVFAAAVFGRALYQRGLSPLASTFLPAFLLLTSWPALLVIDRGNMEMIVWIALAAAVYAWSTGRGYLAATLFGLAASFKLFPIVFLALFVSTREWSKLIVGVVVFLAVFIASLALLGPTIPIAACHFVGGLDYFRREYMAGWLGHTSGVDHSMFSFYKFIVKLVHRHGNNFSKPLALYLKATALAGVLLYFGRIRKLPLVNQLLCLTIISIYFTAFSGDATLMHLYAPLALLIFLAIRADREQKHIPGLRAALLLLGYILSTTTFVTLGVQTVEGEAKCIAIGALLFLALSRPFGPLLNTTHKVPEHVSKTLLPA